MDRKHRRHKCAAPQAPRHPPQHQKQEKHRGGVQQDVRQMMPAGIQPIPLAVQHVGHHRQRMPVGTVNAGERQNDPLSVRPFWTTGFSYTYKPSSKLTNSCRSVCPKTANVIAARKMQTPATRQRSVKPAVRLLDFSGRGSAASGISPAGEMGGLDCAAVAFFFNLLLMKRAKGTPQIDSLSNGKDHVKEWSSGPRLCIQHFAVILIGTEQLAKPKFSTCFPPLACLTASLWLRAGARTCNSLWETPDFAVTRTGIQR